MTIGEKISCPKCGSTILSKNDDDDLECLCGKIIYINNPIIDESLKQKEPVIIQKAHSVKKYPEIKKLAKELRKNGKTYNGVRAVLIKKYDYHPSNSTLSDWLRDIDIGQPSQQTKSAQVTKEAIDQIFIKKYEEYLNIIKLEKEKYPNASSEDIYMEKWVDFTIDLHSFLNNIIPGIRGQSENTFSRGAVYIIQRLSDLLEKMSNYYDGLLE